MSKETMYKCDLCEDTCTEDILKGIVTGINGMSFTNAEMAKKHICTRCIGDIWNLYGYDGPKDKEEEG